MSELKKEEKKIKADAKKLNRQPIKNIKKDIKENYEIGTEYYEDVEEHQEKK